jgi:hypothetical protein
VPEALVASGGVMPERVRPRRPRTRAAQRKQG